MIDGARMITPGVVAWTLAALDLHDEPVICVPGYHLGAELQWVAARKGYNEARMAYSPQTQIRHQPLLDNPVVLPNY